MIKLVYIDTSVVGGVFDEEFKLWTNVFFAEVKSGQFKSATSELLFEELERVPQQVRDYIDSLPATQVQTAIYNDEAKELAEEYISAGILGKSSLTDCRHIAIATINNIMIVTSWNFKHIVNLDKI